MELAIKVGVGFLAYWLLRLAGVPFEWFFALCVVMVIGWPIGWFIGTLIGDETDVDTPSFKAIGWANLVAWLFPIAGIAVAKLTSSIGKESIKSRLFYDVMSVAGYALVLVTVSIYVYLSKSEPMQSELPGVAIESLDLDNLASGERSFARCPYAAMEEWTQEEIQVNCNREPSDEEMRAFQLEQQRALAAQR